jgi:DNA-binding CsgD family transcriptional regulator
MVGLQGRREAGRAPLDVFVGREAELARLADVATQAGIGQPWLVTIEGDPGMGKTSLARRGLAGIADLAMLSARAGQAEADLDFGLVDQLLRAAGDTSDPVIPEEGNRSPISSFAVGAHVLEVVGELATRGPTAIIVDDLQWADHKSVEALTFMLRRLSVDPIIAVVIYRGPREQLDEAAQRMLVSIDNRVHMPLGSLDHAEVAALAAVLAGPLDDEAVQRLYLATGGHPLYLRTVLAEGSGFDPRVPERLALPQSLAAAIGDHLRVLPPDTREILEVLSVLNLRLPLAQLGQAAQVDSPSAAIEPAVGAGLAEWAPEEPSCPVGLRHLLVRDAIYAGIPVARRRALHARAASLVSEAASWEHRVAALEQPDDDLAAELERVASEEAARGHMALAGTHLQWASDISPYRADRERRLLTGALHLMFEQESRALALRPAVEAAGPSPLRGCVLGGMAMFSGQFAEAERRFTEALAQAQADPGSGPLAALIAGWLGGTHVLQGDGEKGLSFVRWALGTGSLDPLAASWARALLGLGALEVAGPIEALAELGHLDADPARVGPLDVDCLAYRGLFRMLAGDLERAVTDMTAGLRMVRGGAPLSLGLHPYVYLTLAQHHAGSWDDALLTSEQAFSVAAIRARPYELPLLHLAATCVPAGRGQAEEAERHARSAEEAAARIGTTQEWLYAAMARAMVCQASGDYLGMADALARWQVDSELDGRSRSLATLWRPLLAEGLIGSGQARPATAVLDQLSEEAGEAGYLQPVVAWLAGWLAEQQGDTTRALELYQRGEQTNETQTPVQTARLLLAHGRLLRRTGQRRLAVERLRRANAFYLALRAAPLLARTEEELAACDLRADPAKKQSVLKLTGRETEVAHLVGRGLSNAEIAGELFISRKAVEYHLSNIYAKCGLQNRQQLRRLVEQWRQPATV